MKKYLVLLAFFVVSWSEYQLVPRDEYRNYVPGTGSNSIGVTEYVGYFYTVEESTHSIKFELKQDAEDFVGAYIDLKNEEQDFRERDYKAIIPRNAFNIKVRKE